MVAVASMLSAFRRGATITQAGREAGYSPEVAALAAEHYERLGLIEVREPGAPGCSSCPGANPEAEMRPGCAGCFFAPKR